MESSGCDEFYNQCQISVTQVLVISNIASRCFRFMSILFLPIMPLVPMIKVELIFQPFICIYMLIEKFTVQSFIINNSKYDMCLK